MCRRSQRFGDATAAQNRAARPIVSTETARDTTGRPSGGNGVLGAWGPISLATALWTQLLDANRMPWFSRLNSYLILLSSMIL